MDAREIMTTAVVTATPNETVGDALRRLEDQSVRHLPIVDGDRLVGMITDRDLREYRLPLTDELAHPERADALLGTPLSALLGAPLITLDLGESVARAVELMLEYGIGAVPVVEHQRDRLAGIISYVDVLRAVLPGLRAE